MTGKKNQGQWTIMTSLQKLPLNPQVNTTVSYPQEMECHIALSMYLLRSMEQTFVYSTYLTFV